MKIVHKRSDALITTSEYITSFYANGQDNIVELPTLFDSHVFPSMESDKDSDDTLKLIYVGRPFEPGRVNPERTNLKERLDKIISAVLAIDADLPVKLDIYGIGLDEYLEVFPEHKIQLSHKDTRVHFHGYIENAIARKRIAGSDFSVFFRDVNRVNLAGFPTKLSESICCGTPAITTRLPNLVKYESKGVVLLAEPGKELDLIRQVADYSREEIAKMKLTCSNSNRFDYRQYIGKVSEFCDKAGL
jgi:glycosyltransferase involved in cell wall biosynthesis